MPCMPLWPTMSICHYVWVGHAGSFTGASAFALLKSESIPLLRRHEFTKFGSEEKVFIGKDSVAEMFVERAKFIQKELKLTTSMRSFCEHMKANLKIVNGEIGRQKAFWTRSDAHNFWRLRKIRRFKGIGEGHRTHESRINRLQNEIKIIPDKKARSQKIVSSLQIARVARKPQPMFYKNK